ncbi:phage regulatory protein [Campylobacter hyointestinalis subsp. hyointestinalis]|uniref:Rha family transcriptional regulator n=1 Tax=Campylobacter hyointestinalis TaxID=198 RepID=UPI000CE4407D|nr:Rha family transcriptional regulator [Campylobacter hyointestinalis]PPB58734.1 phage regulatory protein [Campylobacter hyointestinalis subsp. hyointestinalis]
MNDLVIKHNGILATTQDKVSVLTDNNEHSIQRLIRTYKSDLECFGAIEFENVFILNSKNTKNYKKIYYLNEQQATLLLTYMKNTQKVREAKKLIVEAFYKMKAELTRLKAIEQNNRIANLEAIAISKDKHHAKQISGYKAQLAKHNEQIKLLKAKLTIAEDKAKNLSSNDELLKRLEWLFKRSLSDGVIYAINSSRDKIINDALKKANDEFMGNLHLLKEN